MQHGFYQGCFTQKRAPAWPRLPGPSVVRAPPLQDSAPGPCTPGGWVHSAQEQGSSCVSGPPENWCPGLLGDACPPGDVLIKKDRCEDLLDNKRVACLVAQHTVPLPGHTQAP